MILTITLNPLLEKRLFFSSTKSDNNRALRQNYSAGGKGINISRQLNVLGIKNHALTFIGGASGKKFRHVLEQENISFSAVSTKSEIREATLVFDNEEESLKTYFGVNSEVSTSEIDQFISKLEKAIINSSVVVFAGSLPTQECSKIIELGIELCHKYDKISILDSYGENLKKQLDLGPTIVHNNLDELELSLSTNFKDEANIEELLNSLYNKGVKLSFLSSGKSDTYAAKSDFHYRIKNPLINEINGTGSGDAFVSGLIYGLEKSLIFNDFVKLASAFGAQNASTWDVCKVKLDDANNLVNEVTITEIGKKIKLIDDSPTI